MIDGFGITRQSRSHRAQGGPRARHFNVGGGSGSSGSNQAGQTVATARKLEKEEKDLLKTQNEVLKIELDQITRQNEALAEIYPEATEILKGLTASTQKVVGVFDRALTSLDETATEREIRGVSETQALATLKGEAPLITPDEQKLIDGIFETERRRGAEEITRFAQEAAGARNLRVTDTPIASEAIRGIRELNEGIGAARAKATLDVGRSGQQFREAVRQFQDGLRFQAQQNRLALTGASPFALQAPISTVNPAQAGQTVASTLAPLTGRPTSETFTQSGGANFSNSNWGFNLLGSISTARAKKDIVPFNDREYARAKKKSGVRLPVDGYDRALKLLNDTPITTWRYTWDDPKRHKRTGVILELAPKEIREDDTRLDLVSYAGLLHAAVKAVDRKVTRLTLTTKETRR